MKNINFDKILTEWLIILTCVGYPLQATLIMFLKLESTPINMTFRIGYLLISLYLIINSLIRKRSLSSNFVFVFILFWVIYGARLIYDLEYKGLTFMNYSSFYIYSWAFGCSLIPALAVLLYAHILDVKNLVRNIFFILVISNICIATTLILFSTRGLIGIFISKYNLYGEIKGVPVYLINPISISFFGELLCLAVIIFLIFYHKVISFSFMILLFVTFILGMFNLMAGASRGPLIFFILLAILIITYSFILGLQKVIRKRYSLFYLLRPLILIISVMIVLVYFVPFISKLNFTMLNRMKDLINLQINGMNYDRVYIWESAWQQFITHPILGDSFVNNVGKTYSHNIIMDSLMSTGLLGTIPFLFYLAMPFFLFYHLNQRRKRQLLVVFILYLASFLLSMTSGGLFTVPEFWILSALVIGLSSFYKNPTPSVRPHSSIPLET